MINLCEMMSKAMGGAPKKRRKLKVPDAFAKLVEEEADKRVDRDDVTRVALADAEANGIVFLDEIDKIAVSDVRGGSVSREGVQRDLLPLIEGTTVATKYGPIKTDHILFIAIGRVPRRQAGRPAARTAGAPADPGRTRGADRRGFRPHPVRDPRQPDRAISRVARKPRTSPITFADDGIAALARIAAEVNESAREYRRTAAVDGDGKTARGNQLHRRGSRRRDAGDRRAPSSRGNWRESPRTPISSATCSDPASPIAPHQALRRTGSTAAPRPRPAAAGWRPTGCRCRRAGPADALVEGVARASSRGGRCGSGGRAIELELGADRGPQAAILLGREADLRARHRSGRRHIRRASRVRRRDRRAQAVPGVMSAQVGVSR